MNKVTVTPQNETQLQVEVLRQPLEKLLVCLSEPANLGAAFNRLLFGYLAQGGTMLADEFEHVNALSNFLLACTTTKRKVKDGATILVGEA